MKVKNKLREVCLNSHVPIEHLFIVHITGLQVYILLATSNLTRYLNSYSLPQILLTISTLTRYFNSYLSPQHESVAFFVKL